MLKKFTQLKAAYLNANFNGLTVRCEDAKFKIARYLKIVVNQ